MKGIFGIQRIKCWPWADRASSEVGIDRGMSQRSVGWPAVCAVCHIVKDLAALADAEQGFERIELRFCPPSGHSQGAAAPRPSHRRWQCVPLAGVLPRSKKPAKGHRKLSCWLCSAWAWQKQGEGVSSPSCLYSPAISIPSRPMRRWSPNGDRTCIPCRLCCEEVKTSAYQGHAGKPRRR